MRRWRWKTETETAVGDTLKREKNEWKNYEYRKCRFYGTYPD